jgi:hypothetical protein
MSEGKRQQEWTFGQKILHAPTSDRVRGGRELRGSCLHLGIYRGAGAI